MTGEVLELLDAAMPFLQNRLWIACSPTEILRRHFGRNMIATSRPCIAFHLPAQRQRLCFEPRVQQWSRRISIAP